jgi:Tfp pilus assembly protein PilE
MFENMHGVVLVVHTSGVSAITLGKARICFRGNRIRLRNIRSLGAIKDTIQERLQDRIKSGIEARAEEKQANHSDWSWNVGDEEIPCHYEQYELQGMTRLVAMASDVWLPSDVGAITRAGMEARGGRIHAATEAMRQAFITLGERPRGAVLAIDIAPHEADAPDSDDIVETIRTTTKISKILKSASILGFSIGQVSTFVVVVGILALIGYGVWDKYVRGSEGISASDSTYYGNRKISPQSSSKMPQTQAMKSDTANLNTMDDDDTLGISSNVAPHTTNTATILGFEKSSRTRIPVILSTPKRLTSTELARNVRVSITGPQRIEKYRLEADTARQGLPPNAQRVNIIVEEPLAKGRYTVQLSYRADETSNAEIPSATVNVNIIEKPRSSAPSTFTVFSLTRTIYFGTQMVMGNRQLAVLRKKAEAVLGGSIEGLLPEMSFAYRFITRSGDTTAVQHFAFDQNNVRGIQRGWYVSSSIASVEAWLNYRFENGEDVRIGAVKKVVQQMPPSSISAKANITWRYVARPVASTSPQKQKLRDIEVTVTVVVIDFSDVPIDNSLDGTQPQYATLKNVKVLKMPTIRESYQMGIISIAEAKLRLIGGVEGVLGNPFSGYNWLTIFDENNRVYSELVL